MESESESESERDSLIMVLNPFLKKISFNVKLGD